MQAAELAQGASKTLHPITRILWCSAGEGWATYVEGVTLELGLYGSDFDVLGALMHSTTAPMVADLGIQVMGWSDEQAAEYLAESRPLVGAEAGPQAAHSITGHPGLGVAYSRQPRGHQR